MLKRFIILLTLFLSACAPVPNTPLQLNTNSAADTTGFARATAPRTYTLPQDHGAHLDYQTEWWYYTGNLQAESGEHFGYQLTFFRRGLTPQLLPRDSELATNQIYFAHFAVTSAAANQHLFTERFARGDGKLAGANSAPYSVWLEDWRADALNTDGSRVKLRGKDGNTEIALELSAVKPIVAHGNQGLSPKSDEVGNASYYLSYTRMSTEGKLTFNGQTFNVKGESWFDHEWSTSALGKNGIGWDWFSLQLSDGRELMFFQIRTQEGGIESVSGGTLIEKDGSTKRLSASEVKIEVLSNWTSPQTKGESPSKWRISIPQERLMLEIEPYVNAQEMRVSFAYWEGAVKMSGTSNGTNVTGNGYIELTGYVRSMQGVF